jgi:hypothetical protein|tara:strand:- start:276 stop:731 length:456 start_codon:yes stop_codon:yes gene_type:complete
MKNIIIFDLDGTLALIDERRKISTKKNGKLDWAIFFNSANIKLDKPNIPVINILKNLSKKDFKIYILSGRLETTKKATLKWLSEHNIEFDKLWMRKDDQSEKFISDEILKENWLFDIGKKNIMCVFDDRDKVVNMWRRNGLTCLQVADGDF